MAGGRAGLRDGGSIRYPERTYVKDVVLRTLREDIGTGDVTGACLFPENFRVRARLIAKQPGVFCGEAVFKAVFISLNRSFSFRFFFHDGDTVPGGAAVAEMTGPVRELLAGERTALNFVQRLSGISTLTRCFLERCGKPRFISDTRKTTPGLRALEKYAVAVGGGRNHRFGLYDMVLIKDNHLKAYADRHRLSREEAIRETVSLARRKVKGRLKIEVEIADGREAAVAAEAGADIVMFDHSDAAEVRAFSASLKGRRRRFLVEWSGNVGLRDLPRLSRLPVDWVSAGAITNSVPALDFSLKITGRETKARPGGR